MCPLLYYNFNTYSSFFNSLKYTTPHIIDDNPITHTINIAIEPVCGFTILQLAISFISSFNTQLLLGALSVQ